MYRTRLVLLAFLTLGASCTSRNPGYLEPDASVFEFGLEDGSVKPEVIVTEAGVDALSDALPDASTDALPWPDSVPWKCASDTECSDNLSCTTDKCGLDHICTQTLLAGFCTIGGVCYASGSLNPGNSCQICDPSTNTLIWTSKADNLTCANDGYWCTSDVCSSGQCTHLASTGLCFISNTCYSNKQQNPSNSCQACLPATSQTAWSTVADNTTCTNDGVSCTADICLSGTCTHNASTGWCYISNTCVANGTSSATDPCQECITSVSQSAYTFVAGKSCSTGTGVAQMCVANTCKGWTESTYEPSGSINATSLFSVDHISVAGQVWAAGAYRLTTGSISLGVLLQLDASTTNAVTATKAFRGISYRLAVGDSGVVYHHDGTKWSESTAIEALLGSTNRSDVWGAKVGTSDNFYLSGSQDTSTTTSAVFSCTVLSTGALTCAKHTGFTNGELMGSIIGTLTSAGAQGPLWAVRMGTNVDDDLYYNAGSGTAWSTASPQGCKDSPSGTTACSNTQSQLTNSHASSSSDVWVTSTAGILLHYDGSTWSKVSTGISGITNYDFTAVYTSPSDNLVTVAAKTAGGSGTSVVLFNYNSKLKRWSGPLTVSTSTTSSYDQINDLGGKGYANLWAVGTKYSTTLARLVGWYYRLK